MKTYDYDFFVIGGGSGGIRAARWASQLGAKTALCEEDRLGGTCVIRGCIPKKLMLYASSFAKDFELAKSYGWELDPPRLNWGEFNQARHKEIKRLESIYQGILKNSRVDFIPGRGVLKGPNSLEVKGRLYSAKYILIAAGGRPSALPIKGAELCISSNEIFSLEKQPKSLLVLGAGYIGLEFACIFKGLGSDVSLMFRKNLILSQFDKDLRKHLQEELLMQGIKMLPEREPVEIEKEKGGLIVKDSRGESWKGDLVLMAAGRKANTEALNLPAAGIKTKGAQICVNERFETSCPGIFAVGDCIDQPYQLTPVALSQGMFVSELLFSKRKERADFSYEAVPSAVFTNPEAAVVGLSEERALKDGFSLKIYESRFRPLKLSLSSMQSKTYMKLVVCRKTDRILGCHIAGDSAAEILQGFAAAVRNKMTKADLDKTIGLHPTSAEELVTMRNPRD